MEVEVEEGVRAVGLGAAVRAVVKGAGVMGAEMEAEETAVAMAVAVKAEGMEEVVTAVG